MTQATAPDAWTETFLITIKSDVSGSTAIEFPATVTTYDITGGDKDFTQIANGTGGRIKKFEAQTPYEVALEAYSLEAGTVSGAVGKGFADLLATVDSSQPLSISADHNRDQYLLAIAHILLPDPVLYFLQKFYIRYYKPVKCLQLVLF